MTGTIGTLEPLEFIGSSGFYVDNASRSVCFVHHEAHEGYEGSDILNCELRALRVLRGEYFLSCLVAASPCKFLRG
jgi:hypothetical protein